MRTSSALILLAAVALGLGLYGLDRTSSGVLLWACLGVAAGLVIVLWISTPGSDFAHAIQRYFGAPSRSVAIWRGAFLLAVGVSLVVATDDAVAIFFGALAIARGSI